MALAFLTSEGERVVSELLSDLRTSLRRKWQPTPGLLPGKSHGQRSLVDYSLRGCKESDTTERLHCHCHLVVQWLRHHAPNAEDVGSIPGQGTRAHVPQLRFLTLQLKTPHGTRSCELQLRLVQTNTFF